MSKKITGVIGVVLGLLVALSVLAFVNRHSLTILNPAGTIAAKEKTLMLVTVGLSLIVVLPVFIMTFGIAWRYREGNTKARYTPDWDHNVIAETIWWGLPLIIILVLSTITWKSSHELDPFKAIASNKKPLTIQVIALQWKWLFIYPEQQIATVNFIKFPKDTPLNFQITSDTAMNSFWIPKLGGQMYAMAGMSTQLHLQSSEYGSMRGSSANLSGPGFAGMTFTADSASQDSFDSFVTQTKSTGKTLDARSYAQLARPSKDVRPQGFVLALDQGLYDTVVAKYMPYETGHSSTSDESSMHMDNMKMEGN
jgi:cytochrome o ubiquinol oxidase subunit 2